MVYIYIYIYIYIHIPFILKIQSEELSRSSGHNFTIGQINCFSPICILMERTNPSLPPGMSPVL